MNEEKKKTLEELINDAIVALGELMSCDEVCPQQRAVMKINRFKAWLMELNNK